MIFELWLEIMKIMSFKPVNSNGTDQTDPKYKNHPLDSLFRVNFLSQSQSQRATYAFKNYYCNDYIVIYYFDWKEIQEHYFEKMHQIIDSN